MFLRNTPQFNFHNAADSRTFSHGVPRLWAGGELTIKKAAVEEACLSPTR